MIDLIQMEEIKERRELILKEYYELGVEIEKIQEQCGHQATAQRNSHACITTYCLACGKIISKDIDFSIY